MDPAAPDSGPPHNQRVSIVVDPAAQRRWRQRVWIAVGIAAAAWLAYLVREIWLPLGIAFLVAMVLDPVVDRMERRGWSRLWASALIYAGFFAAAGIALYVAAPVIAEQATRISEQVSQYIPSGGNQAQAHAKLHRLLDRSKAPPYVRVAVERGIEQMSAAVSRSVGWLSDHLMAVLSNLLWVVIIPIVTFYALKDFHLIFAKALLLVPRGRRDFVQALFADVTAIFARYVRGLAMVSALNGVATWALLALFGVPNSLTLGVIAGLLYSLPYLGALATLVLTAGVVFIAKGLTLMLVVVGASVLLHQVIFDQIISPRVLGGQVGLHPILSIMALLVGNLLLGMVGMLLAVPVAASIQIVVLALVPKLRQDIDLTAVAGEPPDTGPSLEEDTKDQQVAVDATEELHRSVSQVVEHIEDRAAADTGDR